MAKYQLIVKEPFEAYVFGDRISGATEMARVTAEYPDHVMRESIAAETEPTKAEVKAAGVPVETQARVDVGLPPGPVPAADEKTPARTKNVTLKG